MMANHKFRGVFAHKDGGFVVNIGHHGKREYLGYFKDFDDACAARLKAEVRYFGHVLKRRHPKIVDGVGHLPLHGRQGKFYGWALVDKADFSRTKCISWTVDPRGYVAGRPAGSKNSVTLHRFIMADPAGQVIDHENRNKLDNRRSNLRVCSQSENSKNTRLAKNNTSGAKGVSRTANGRWRARIWKSWREIHLGTFDTVEEAGAAYDAAALRLHMEFASTNSELSADVAHRAYSQIPGAHVSVARVVA